MTTATMPMPPTTALVPYRFSVDEFEKIVEAGILDGKRVELIEGLVVQKMIHNPAHDNALDRLNDRIRAIVPQGWRVRIQSSITLASSIPEPDVCVAPGGPFTYATRRPGPSDIGLLVEVSDATLAYDRHTKGPLSAGAGIVEYWIVNIPDQQIEVYTQPSGPTTVPTYAQQQIYPLGSSVPLVLGGVTLGQIAVDEILA